MSTTTQPDAPATDLDPAFLEHLLDTITETIPIGDDCSDRAHANRRNSARIGVLALHPTDAFQAMLAGEIVAAHHAITDAFRRAADPDLPPAMATRLRANAATIARMMQATLRTLRAQQNQPSEGATQETPAPGRAPRPRAAKPDRSRPSLIATGTAAPLADPEYPPLIPYRPWEEMTMEERRERFGYKGDPNFRSS